MSAADPPAPPSSRRARLIAAAVAIAIAGGAAGGVLAATGGASGSRAVATASVATFHRAMVAKLDAQHAHFAWVACVRTPDRFDGVSVVRCNVDFGDPHIQAYCSVFRGGRLLTNADDPAIPCGHDDAGYSQAIHVYRG